MNHFNKEYYYILTFSNLGEHPDFTKCLRRYTDLTGTKPEIIHILPFLPTMAQ